MTPRQAESFVACRLSSEAKVGTVDKDIRTLKRVFNLAIDPRGYLRKGQNPFTGIRQRRQSNRAIRYVTAEEFQRLLDATDSLWWRALLLVCYTTAVRVGEAINLTWADLDFEDNWIRIVGKE